MSTPIRAEAKKWSQDRVGQAQCSGKFTSYQTYNPTLTDYVLVSQDRPQIEHFHREKNGTWTYECHQGLKATVKLPSIECRLKAAAVYRRIVFKGNTRTADSVLCSRPAITSTESPSRYFAVNSDS